MKKIVCLLVSYVIWGLGVAFAQEITSLQYFKVKKEISGRMRLIVPDSPELAGPCGACVEKVDYRTIREKVRSVLKAYCQENNWFPTEDWLEKYAPLYMIYFDKDMKIISYDISVSSETFSQMTENQLKEMGTYLVENLDLGSYYRMDSCNFATSSWAACVVGLKLLLE
ncbi:hypothetical protein [Parabacteroides johnsonii]|uniref:hypothetical protein n=1 Tax=Parabacteroides johnsonii TaxID=387661 RepID=UPI00265CF377|nr:hypothetical protein [Parabacteroides johnsonii]